MWIEPKWFVPSGLWAEALSSFYWKRFNEDPSLFASYPCCQEVTRASIREWVGDRPSRFRIAVDGSGPPCPRRILSAYVALPHEDVFHGFQYVCVQGLSTKPELQNREEVKQDALTHLPQDHARSLFWTDRGTKHLLSGTPLKVRDYEVWTRYLSPLEIKSLATPVENRERTIWARVDDVDVLFREATLDDMPALLRLFLPVGKLLLGGHCDPLRMMRELENMLVKNDCTLGKPIVGEIKGEVRAANKVQVESCPDGTSVPYACHPSVDLPGKGIGRWLETASLLLAALPSTRSVRRVIPSWRTPLFENMRQQFDVRGFRPLSSHQMCATY